MNKEVNNLLELINQNPTLKIVPMVDNDVCAGDDYSSWLGSWREASVDEICNINERTYFKLEDMDQLIYDISELVYMNKYSLQGESTQEEELDVYNEAINIIDKMKWERVIIVNIGLP